MRMKNNMWSILVFTCVIIFSSSCGGEYLTEGLRPGIVNSQTIESIIEEDKTMMISTPQELFQYIKDNGIDLPEDAFEGVDIDGFINSGYIDREWIDRIGFEGVLNSYKNHAALEHRYSFLAKGIFSVDSTDEEYRMFLEELFKTIGYEGRLWYKDENIDWREVYEINTEKGTYYLSIGKTNKIGQLSIAEGNVFGCYEILTPYGEMVMSNSFCYSGDNKFFLTLNSTDDYMYELAEAFTKVVTPQ